MISLARKYRPKRLDDIVGQAPVVQTLKNAFDKNKLHHAYLFAGLLGSGKTSLARIIAATENCNNGNKPCGKCRLCLRVFEGKHTDIQEIDAASGAGKVDQIRQLKNSAQYGTVDGAKTKYYIIDECLPPAALVLMAGGDEISIGNLVETGLKEQRNNDIVRSKDMNTGKVIHQPIRRYIKMPNDKQMYEIKIKDASGNTKSIRITGNHNVFVGNGEKIKAQDLQVGDKVFLSK